MEKIEASLAEFDTNGATIKRTAAQAELSAAAAATD